jgi:peptidoglycan/xylan/chitin deacetylase (PgdA/CDA1 family)
MQPTSRRRFLGQLASTAAISPLLSRSVSAREAGVAAGSADQEILVTLWFDAEDYILPEDDDATLRLATMLTSLGVKATFKVVGEKARVLEQRGRTDVIEALRKHDVGYHSNTHSQQPTPAVYLQHAGWEDGVEEFFRRESQGAKDLERIFGVTPICYGQPGSSWGPQSYPALRRMGIRMYLDEADQIGLDDQPFYYGGMLNVFRMRSTVTRMELEGGDSLEKGKAAFADTVRALRAKRGRGTISVYYHPNEWVHAEFWDAVNFSKGANPPRSAWKRPGLRPRAETDRAFADFEQYIRFIQAQPGVTFAPASAMLARYADPHADFAAQGVLEIARASTTEIGPLVVGAKVLSAGEIFSVLTAAAAARAQAGAWPDATPARPLDGPSRPYVASSGTPARRGVIPWEAFARALDTVVDEWRATGRIPAEVWIGSASLSPADFLATTASVVAAMSGTGGLPATVASRTGRVTAEDHVAKDAPELWGWVIFPEGFRAPTLMEHARLQAWTLKPAVLRS